jgi:hypothetical protein
MMESPMNFALFIITIPVQFSNLILTVGSGSVCRRERGAEGGLLLLAFQKGGYIYSSR